MIDQKDLLTLLDSRQEQLSKAMQLEIQSLFELRMALKKEEENRQRELKVMSFEDVWELFVSFNLTHVP